MHGSPWSYDVSIPLMFAGPAVKTGVFSGPASQQDVAPTLAAALGVQMPPTATGRVLPVLRSGFARPRVVMLLVLDGMRRDYFDRDAASMPTLTALRHQSAWFSQARVNFLPVPEGSKCERTVAGRQRVDESQNRLVLNGTAPQADGCRCSPFSSVSGIRSRRDDGDD